MTNHFEKYSTDLHDYTEQQLDDLITQVAYAFASMDTDEPRDMPPKDLIDTIEQDHADIWSAIWLRTFDLMDQIQEGYGSDPRVRH
jgi:hypothetical protein